MNPFSLRARFDLSQKRLRAAQQTTEELRDLSDEILDWCCRSHAGAERIDVEAIQGFRARVREAGR